MKCQEGHSTNEELHTCEHCGPITENSAIVTYDPATRSYRGWTPEERREFLRTAGGPPNHDHQAAHMTRQSSARAEG